MALVPGNLWKADTYVAASSALVLAASVLKTLTARTSAPSAMACRGGASAGSLPGTCRPPLTGVNHTHLRATRPRLRRHPTHFIGAPVWTFSELTSEAGGLTRRSRGPSDLGRAGARAVWPGSPPRVGVKGLQRGIVIVFSRFAAFGCGQRAAPGANARREQRDLPGN